MDEHGLAAFVTSKGRLGHPSVLRHRNYQSIQKIPVAHPPFNLGTLRLNECHFLAFRLGIFKAQKVSGPYAKHP